MSHVVMIQFASMSLCMPRVAMGNRDVSKADRV